MGANILIVEDEEPLTTLLRYNLEAEGYEVDTVTRGDDADTRLKEDGAGPRRARLDAAGPVRHRAVPPAARAGRRRASVPIIMLTARGEESERVRGLATGADDYIVKPFSVPELIARVRALLRRASPERVADDPQYRRSRTRPREDSACRAPAAPVDLGPTEFRLLEYLMERPGRVFSREQLLDGVWGSDVYIDERTVDVHVGRLRKALNRGHTTDPIRTVRGAGYALDDRFGKAS